MEHFDQFEDFWREELESFESEPSPKEWEDIKNRIHPKRRVIPFWWLVPLAATLVGVGVFRYFSSEKNGTDATHFVDQMKEGEQNKPSLIQPNDKNDTFEFQQESTNKNAKESSIQEQLSSKTLAGQRNNLINNNIKVVDNEKIEYKKENNLEIGLTEEKKDGQSKTEVVDIPNVPITKTEQTERGLLLAIEALPTKLMAISIEDALLPNIEKLNDWAKIKETVEKKKSKRKGFYASVGTSMNLRNIAPVKTDAFTMTSIQLPSLTSINRLGWQASLGYKMPINRHLDWRSSLQYQGFLAKIDYRLKLPEVTNVETIGEVTGTGLSLKYEKIDLKQTDKNEEYVYHNISINNELGWKINSKNTVYVGCTLGKIFGEKSLSTAFNSSYSYKLKYVAIEPYFQYHLKYYASKEPIYNFQPYAFGINFVF